MRFFEGFGRRILREENERLQRLLADQRRVAASQTDTIVELRGQLAPLQRELADAALANAKLGDTAAALTRQLDRARALIRFHKQVAGVYRRRWEASARPGMGPRDPAAKAAAKGEATIAAAIDARSIPGDPESSRHLRSYADRRIAEMRTDGKGEVDYDVIANEILDGEDDDE